MKTASADDNEDEDEGNERDGHGGILSLTMEVDCDSISLVKWVSRAELSHANGSSLLTAIKGLLSRPWQVR
ncbi:hypothetical protein Ancab_001241 [Ancistrocladus abbreviatus]